MRRTQKTVVVLNPDKDYSLMKHRRRHMNPESIGEVAKDSGMALGAGAVVAVGAAAAMVAADKITYSSTTTPADAASYRTLAASGMVGVLGVALQWGNPTLAALGKAMLVVAVAAPGAVFVKGKLDSAMAPAAPAAPALTAPSQGMYRMSGNLMGMNSPYLNPSGFAADAYGPYAATGELSSSIASPSYIPPAR